MGWFAAKTGKVIATLWLMSFWDAALNSK